MTTKITSIAEISLSPSGLENAVVVESDGDLQLKKDARLPNNKSLRWRNATDSADLTLAADTSNNLKYNSLTLVSASLGLIPLASIENGGGGGGGFEIDVVTTTFTAETNVQYLVDTSVAGFTGTLPSGTDQFSIRFSDDQRTWGVNFFTIQPAAGQKIDGFAFDEPLICDLTGASVLLTWDGIKWVIDSNVVLGGVSGSGGGGSSTTSSSSGKNYIARPDNANADWASSNIALVTVATDSVSANLPEAATKTTAIRITRISGTTGYVRYRFVVDPADLGKKFQLQWNQKYAGTAGDYTIEMWSFTASDYTTGPVQLTMQSSSIPQATNSGTLSTSFDTAANKYVELRIVAVAGTTPLYLSGVLVGPGFADLNTSGLISNTTQSIAGSKTFAAQTNIGPAAGIAGSHQIFGSTTAAAPSLDILGNVLKFGSDANTVTRTTATTKIARLVSAHYTNAEENVQAFAVQSLVSTTLLNIGGGSAAQNTVTSIDFYTAADNITLTGTVKGSISSNGSWILGAATGTTATHLLQSDNAAVTTIKRTVAGRPHIIFKTSDDTTRGFVGCDASGFAVVNAAGATVNFLVTDAGLATIGNTGQAGTHNFNGAITATGDITAFSDARLKENIEPLQNALKMVQDLRGVSFTKDGQRGVGFIAQELLEILPEVVRENQNGFLSVAYGNVTALLVEAIKELSEKVLQLEEKLNQAS